MTSPTSLTLKLCEKNGWIATVAEYWQPNFASNAVIQAAKQYVAAGMTVSKDELKKAVEAYDRAGPGRRKDLFGFIDIVAITPDKIIGIQACKVSSQANRRRKIIDERTEASRAWIESGNAVQVWGWNRYAKAIKRRFWRETITEITLADVTPVLPPF